MLWLGGYSRRIFYAVTCGIKSSKDGILSKPVLIRISGCKVYSAFYAFKIPYLFKIKIKQLISFILTVLAERSAELWI